MKVILSCLILCDPIHYLVHGILQARILRWVAFPFSSGSSQPRNWTRVSCIAGRFFTNWAIREVPIDNETVTNSPYSQRAKYYWYYLPVKVYLFYLLEKAMAPHSSTFAWKIPWTEEPGGLQPMGSLGVRHDWVNSLWLFTFMHWRRKWQPTPVFLPGESQGRGSLMGCRLWGCTELDTTEAT